LVDHQDTSSYPASGTGPASSGPTWRKGDQLPQRLFHHLDLTAIRKMASLLSPYGFFHRLVYWLSPVGCLFFTIPYPDAESLWNSIQHSLDGVAVVAGLGLGPVSPAGNIGLNIYVTGEE